MTVPAQERMRWPSLGELASMVNAIGVFWLLSFVPNVRPPLIVEAIVYVVLAWAVTTYLTLVFSGAEKFSTPLFRASLGGIWLAPALVLSLARSPLFVLAGFFFLMATTYVLVAGWMSRSPGKKLPRRFWGVVASFALQLSAVAYVRNQWFLAVVFAVTSAIVVAAASLWWGGPARPLNGQASLARIAISLTLAVAITAVAMLEMATDTSQPFPFARALFDPADQQMASRKPRRAQYSVTRLAQPPDGGFGTNGSLGVVLRPKDSEKKRIPKIEPPRLSGRGLREPIRIAFRGEYWLYQAPLSAPPRGTSIVREGDPYLLSFRTTNIPLLMEARQKLDGMIDLSCCSRVDLEVRNAAPVSEDALELILIDSIGGRSESLGIARMSGPAQTLSFRVPSGTRIRQFDTIRVRFHRGIFPLESARIAIDSAVFVPRV